MFYDVGRSPKVIHPGKTTYNPTTSFSKGQGGHRVWLSTSLLILSSIHPCPALPCPFPMLFSSFIHLFSLSSTSTVH